MLLAVVLALAAVVVLVLACLWLYLALRPASPGEASLTDTARQAAQATTGTLMPGGAAPSAIAQASPGASPGASTRTPGAPASLPPTPSGCPPPGWVPYAVQAGETLFYLADSTGTTVKDVMQANCLQDTLLQIVYLPSLPPARPTPAGGRPASWPTQELTMTITDVPPPNQLPVTLPPVPSVLPQSVQPTFGLNCDDPTATICQPATPQKLTETIYDPTPPPGTVPLVPRYPCDDSGDPQPHAGPWIDYPERGSGPVGQASQGVAVLLHACRFSDPTGITASLVRSDGQVETPPEKLVDAPLSDLTPSRVERAEINWIKNSFVLYPGTELHAGSNPSQPGLLPYTYTLQLKSGQEQASATFELIDSGYPRLMIRPLVGKPGDTFTYYDFSPDPQPVQVSLYAIDPIH